MHRHIAKCVRDERNIFELLCFQGHKREGALGGGAGPQVRVPRRESALHLDPHAAAAAVGGFSPAPATPVRVEESGVLDELPPDSLM